MYKNILLTGCTQGLGKFLCEEFYNSGYKIIGIDIKSEKDIDNDFFNMLEGYFQIDLREIYKINETINNILKVYHIDILINNAGIKSFKIFSEFSNKEIDDIFFVNTIAPIKIIHAILPYFIKNKHGKIINISSNAAFQGYKTGSIYGSSKLALLNFTESIGKELYGSGVTINTICPSTIITKEFLIKYPNERTNRNLILPKSVFKKIVKIISSNQNGKIIPIIPFKTKIKYLFVNVFKNLKYIINE
ncbi:MAG: SDR family oxidoreductase [Bacteroidales bacterium]|nr:SDR family oxidoreductase [Bacteroidales bacterium]